MDFKSILLHYVLPLLAYGAITGIANLILSRKSQIELWAESHPKAAAAQKLLRAIGLDPWQIISAVSLWATSKLPDAQRSEGLKEADPKLPKPSKPPSIYPMGGMLMLCLVLSMTGCGLLASAAPYLAEAGVVIADAVNDIQLVADLIAKFPGLSPDVRGSLEKKLEAAQLALQAAAAADNGAKDLTAAQLDASFSAFRAAWFDLADALAAAGIVPGAKIGGAVGGEVSLPKPLALRPVVVK